MLGSPILETALGLALVFLRFSLLNRVTHLRMAGAQPAPATPPVTKP